LPADAVNFTPASPASLAVFCAILVAVAYALLLAVHLAYRSFKVTAVAGTLFGIWLGIQSALVASGRMPHLPLNGLPFFFVPVVVIWTGLAISPVGRRLATTLPLAALVGFQAFRLPLELVLHAWAAQGTIPGTMT
jgi:hypothetical protein